MYRKIISTGVFAVIILMANASEVWLEPKKFRYEVGEVMKIDFREDVDFTQELWDMTKNKVELLQWYSVSGMKDILKEVKPTRGNNVGLKLPAEGTQMVIMRSHVAFRDWEAAKFDGYLEENGIDEVIEERKKSNGPGEPAKEFYTRFAKVLVQAGEKTDDTYKKRTKLRIEIVPDQNPYDMKPGDYLQCLVLVDGKPLPHALVKVWGRFNLTTFVQNIYTEDDGTIKFPISSNGVWMVSTMRMIPSEKKGADWQSLCASLVFGIQ